MNWGKILFLFVFLILFTFLGCATYKHTHVRVDEVETYPSHISEKGILIAVDPCDSPEEAKEEFYVDVTSQNFYPVLLIMRNDTSSRIIILKDSFVLEDADGRFHRPVNSQVMADTCEHNKMAYAFIGGIFSYMSAEDANKKMAADWRDKELPDSLILNPERRTSGFVYFELPVGKTTKGCTLKLEVENLDTKVKSQFEFVL